MKYCQIMLMPLPVFTYSGIDTVTWKHVAIHWPGLCSQSWKIGPYPDHVWSQKNSVQCWGTRWYVGWSQLSFSWILHLVRPANLNQYFYHIITWFSLFSSQEIPGLSQYFCYFPWHFSRPKKVFIKISAEPCNYYNLSLNVIAHWLQKSTKCGSFCPAKRTQHDTYAKNER